MLTTFPESRSDLETVTPSSADDFDSFKNLFTSHEISIDFSEITTKDIKK